MFLHRDELVGRWDASVFLDVPFTETARRMAVRDGTHPDPEHASMRRYVEGQRIYFAACRPWERATFLVDNSDPVRPRLVPGDRWELPSDVEAAYRRISSAIRGWDPPVAHGVGLVPGDTGAPAPEHFPLIKGPDHRLPAAVLATVVGHANGTGAYPLSRAQLQRAVAMLAPAQACTAHNHPNLWTWRDVYLPALAADPAATPVAVFLGDDGAAPDAVTAAFRRALGPRG
jgi:hypothetical protein